MKNRRPENYAQNQVSYHGRRRIMQVTRECDVWWRYYTNKCYLRRNQGNAPLRCSLRSYPKSKHIIKPIIITPPTDPAHYTHSKQDLNGKKSLDSRVARLSKQHHMMSTTKWNIIQEKVKSWATCVNSIVFYTKNQTRVWSLNHSA